MRYKTFAGASGEINYLPAVVLKLWLTDSPQGVLGIEFWVSINSDEEEKYLY